jgi:ERCC4-type nuclease
MEKSMDILTSASPLETVRVIQILKRVISESERKGSEVKPHYALLKGEFLENLVIVDIASPKRQNVMLSLYSNATLCEFK